MNSIRARLTLLNVGVLILVLLLLGAIVFYMARTSLIHSIDNLLLDRAHQIERQGFAPPGQQNDPPNAPENQGPRNRRPGPLPIPPGRFLIFDGMNRSINRPEARPFDPPTLDAARHGGGIYTTVKLDGEDYRVYTQKMPFENPPDEIGQFAEALEPTNRALGVLTSSLLSMIPFAVVLAAVGGLYLTGRALRPVRDMQRTAQSISAENLSDRLRIPGNDEFAQLGGTINRMLDRLQDAFGRLAKSLDQQRRFTADASHELKTPLTVIKTNTGLALSQERTVEDYKKTLETVDRAATSMNSLVTNLLTLARADSGALALKARPVDLNQLVEEAIDLVRSPSTARIDWEPNTESPAAYGDPDALRRVMVNLLTNALTHTPATGAVRVCLEGGIMNKIVVADTGQGIPPEHLPHLTERFYRVDSARSGGGTGLGLAICKEILEAHGGEIAFQSEVGKGTTVTVTLPSKRTH